MTIDKVLQEMGFSEFTTEHEIHVVGEGDERVFLALYIDDLHQQVIPIKCETARSR